MPDRRLINPEDFDWFFRNVISELAVYHRAMTSGNRADAAKVLGITPQAVGKSLDRLEKRLKDINWSAGILDRKNKIDLGATEAGELLLEFASEIIAISAKFSERFREFEFLPVFRFAIDDALCPRWEAEFRTGMVAAGYQDIEALRFTGPDYMEKVYASVRDGSAHIGITGFPPKVKTPFQLRSFDDEPLELFFSPEKTAIPNRAISIAALVRNYKGLRIAIQKRSAAGPLHGIVTNYLSKQGANLGHDQLWEFDTIQEVKDCLVQHSATIAILPRYYFAAAGSDFESLERRHLAPTAPVFPWGAIYRGNTSHRALDIFFHQFHWLPKEPAKKRGPKKRVPTLKDLGMTEEEFERRFLGRSGKYE